MSSKIKKFDIYYKAQEGITKQTLIGAFVTIISVAIVCLLLYSEVTTYMKKDVVSRMVADVSIGVEAVKLDFDVLFPNAPCDKITFLQEVTRGTLHTHDPEKVEKDLYLSSGCRVHGHIVTDKVGGNFRFGIESDKPADLYSRNPLEFAKLLNPPNISHKINHIMFLPAEGRIASVEDIPGMEHPLNGQSSNLTEGTGLYQYAIQVVPTHYKSLNGVFAHANQYSVTEREVNAQQVAMGVSISGQYFKDFYGLVFTYDFYPVMLVLEERKESIFEFASNLCCIIGGVITMLGLVERCISGSAKAIIGKED